MTTQTDIPLFTDDNASEEDRFLDYIKRPCVMNKRNATELIAGCNEIIANLHRKIQTAANRVEKNVFYQQIDNRKAQIRYAESFLIEN